MGDDLKCGCRCSMGHWFLCDKHENQIVNENIVETNESEKLEEMNLGE